MATIAPATSGQPRLRGDLVVSPQGDAFVVGPTVGAAITIALAEYLRVVFGVKLLGMADTIYGLALILIIIFLPAGLYGGLAALARRRLRPARAIAG